MSLMHESASKWRMKRLNQFQVYKYSMQWHVRQSRWTCRNSSVQCKYKLFKVSSITLSQTQHVHTREILKNKKQVRWIWHSIGTICSRKRPQWNAWSVVTGFVEKDLAGLIMLQWVVFRVLQRKERRRGWSMVQSVNLLINMLKETSRILHHQGR